MVAEGDKVAARFTFVGTQTGDFMGVPATGKRVEGTGRSTGIDRYEQTNSIE